MRNTRGTFGHIRCNHPTDRGQGNPLFLVMFASYSVARHRMILFDKTKNIFFCDSASNTRPFNQGQIHMVLSSNVLDNRRVTLPGSRIEHLDRRRITGGLGMCWHMIGGFLYICCLEVKRACWPRGPHVFQHCPCAFLSFALHCC